MSKHSFTPDPEQLALWPDASGNVINGLDEVDFRKPVHVYWGNPDEITFGAVQKWFYAKNTAPELEKGRAERKREEQVPLPPLAAQQVAKSSQDWTAEIKAKALALGAEDVGIAEMNPDWCFEGWDLPYSHVVMMAIAMDYPTMTTAPEPSAGAEVVRQYTRGMWTSKALAGWLREQGHDALPEHGPFAEGLTLIPPALAAWLATFFELATPVAIMIGLCCRLATLPLIVMTLVIQFTYLDHADHFWWLAILGLLALRGPGPMAVDTLLQRLLVARYPAALQPARWDDANLPHVVVVGAGFGGVAAVQGLKHSPCRITLIDRRNYHLFQPLLYQIATATLNPADIATPSRLVISSMARKRSAIAPPGRAISNAAEVASTSCA